MMAASNSLGSISQAWNALLGDTTGRIVSRRSADGAGTLVPGIHGMMAIGALIAATVPGVALPVAAYFGSVWRAGKDRG